MASLIQLKLYSRLLFLNLVCGLLLVSGISAGIAQEVVDQHKILQPDNVVAWCIVPFDAQKRSPAERAAMLKRLGIKRCAYDWREQHVAEFEEEILAYQKEGIEFFAFWGVHETAFQLFQKYDLHPQIWQMIGEPEGDSQEAKVESAAQQLLPLAKRTAELGCKLAIYNHGGWGGEPANMVAVCRRLKQLGQAHVGLVYNFHHGHSHISDWSQQLDVMLPHLHCLNLNGMNDQGQPKILGLAQGQYEMDMIRTLLKTDYAGPVGILDHREQLDAEKSLDENLRGLAWIRKELKKNSSGGAKPVPVQPEPVPQESPDERPELAPDDAPDDAPDEKELPLSDGRILPGSDTKLEYSPQFVAHLIAEAKQQGDFQRGSQVFASANFACMSCHRVGEHGGTVGPELAAIMPLRKPKQIVESLYWPRRDVEEQYKVWRVLTIDGTIHSGIKISENDQEVTLRDATNGKQVTIAVDDIEDEALGSTSMPDGLSAAMTHQQQLDLVFFLMELGKDGNVPTLAMDSHHHAPEPFEFTAAPHESNRWPHANAPINRLRVYDFYTKQAEHFRRQDSVPRLLSAYPSLDGETTGHWGNQDETTWSDGRWNRTKFGSVQCGVFTADDLTVPRGVCLQLGDNDELSACFNPDTLTYDAIWQGGFVSSSSVRHGFMNGLNMEGTLISKRGGEKPQQPFKYHGFYRIGSRVVFSYRIGDVEYLDAPWIADGEFYREFAPAKQHSLVDSIRGGKRQWPQTFQTTISYGTAQPYSVDTIELPFANPWNALLFCGGHDFLPDGSALVCTMQGDVWHVTLKEGQEGNPGVARWQRFASGLHHALDLLVVEDQIFVQCRDQLTCLHDTNGDGEADFYECRSNAFTTSPAGHDFICGLQCDHQGNFYTASGNQGLLKISADGKRAEVLATGLRNPDGLGMMPDGTLTLPCSEGDWTPASAICAVRPTEDESVLHFGYGGPQHEQAPALPLAYLPRGIDNSSGGQTWVTSEKFGPLNGSMIHTSFGSASWFTLLQDEIGGQRQGGIVPMTGDFESGVHRARFNPVDGQLYLSGMNGWGTYGPKDGCFQRVRYTNDPVQTATGFHIHENGVLVTFSQLLDREIATRASNHFAQCWNYRYSGAYGSPEYSPSHPGVAGHDGLEVTTAHVLEDGRSLFLEIPLLQPVSQLHLRMNVNRSDEFGSVNPYGSGNDLFLTVHRLDRPFTNFPNYRPQTKVIAAHPMLADMALNTHRRPNPWGEKRDGARPIEIKVGSNLTYQTAQFRVKANEWLAFSLVNSDVVPHNWVLVKPGKLQEVGEISNRLIADPAAFARHYIPNSDEVLNYTDVVSPGSQQTIYFKTPDVPGRYPYLCTFPGHWMVMNGVMIVE